MTDERTPLLPGSEPPRACAAGAAARRG